MPVLYKYFLPLFILLPMVSAADSISPVRDTLADTSLVIMPPARDTARFLSDSLQQPEPVAQKRVHHTEVWVFIACCFTFLLAGLNRRINEKRHDQSVTGFLNINLLGQSTERSFYEFNIHQLISLGVHNLILALWGYYFLEGGEYYQIVGSSLLFFILLFFLISIIYLCKFFFQYLVLNILQIDELPVLLVKCTIGLGYLTTLISLPLFMVIYYIQYPEWEGVLVIIFLILFGIYLLFRSFKTLQLFGQFFRGSIFYNILYFCALEIVPLLVTIKISMILFNQ